MTNRLIHGMSRADYDARTEDNWSTIKRIAESPAHYKWGVDNEEEDSDTFRFGRCAHLAILEPEEYAKQVVVWTGGNRTGKKWEAFEAEHFAAGHEILTQTQAKHLEAIIQRVRECGYVQEYVRGGRSEVSMLWDTQVVPGHIVPCKGRLDYVTDDALVDLKMTASSSPERFGGQAWKLGYLGQCAFYGDGYFNITGERKRFVILAIEKWPPYNIQPYLVTPEQMAAGRSEYLRLLSTLSLCRITNEWPGYATGMLPLTIPAWAQRQAEMALHAENLENLEAAQ